MSDVFGRLAERQILKAQAEGQLDGLEGSGKPLPHRPGEALIDAADAVGHRIMAEAGAVPQEITLRKALAEARAAWQAAGTPDDKAACMREIADLELRYSIAVEARRKFMVR